MSPQPAPGRVWIKRRVAVGIMLFQAILLVLIGGAFLRAEHQNTEQNKEINESIDTGRGLLTCLISYADQMTTALEARDAVNSTARAAAVAWLDALLDQFNNPNADNQTIYNTILAYRDALERLNKPKQEFSLQSYPDIKACLRKNDLPVPEDLKQAQASGDLYRLIAYTNPPREFCMGRRITIFGTPQGEIITGTGRHDVIWGNDGGDLINGGRGRDRICGGDGGDIIDGGPGLDRANGGPGTDVCLSSIKRKHCP